MKLARDDAQEGHVLWSGKDGTTLSYKQQSFTMVDLLEMMQKLVQSLKSLMDELVFAPYPLIRNGLYVESVEIYIAPQPHPT